MLTSQVHLGIGSFSTAEVIAFWQAAQWDGDRGFTAQGDAAWAWLVNLNHTYFVSDCLAIGQPQVEPHGHGWPITANIAEWTWTCNIDVLHSDYVLFARAQGESLGGVVLHHGLRNIILPALTLQFASLSELFGGSVRVEQVFAYPGLGAATVQAALRSDVPLLVGIVFFSALFVYTGNTLADLAYPLIDPRIHLGGWRS